MAVGRLRTLGDRAIHTEDTVPVPYLGEDFTFYKPMAPPWPSAAPRGLESMMASTPAVIQGVVTDDAGQPLAEVAVALAEGPGPVPDIAALTGPDGRFAITAPMPGSYTIVATAPGSRTGSVTAQVDAAGSPDTNVQIRVSDTA